MVPTDSAPSLQRLLALDKSTDAFDEQLQEAVRVLRWERIFENSTHSVLDLIPQKQRFDARAEWVLKWLLGKLQVEGTTGTDARLNAKSWVLLEHLIASIPSTNAARLLNQNKFLSILQSTLDNVVSTLGNAASPAASVSPTPGSASTGNESSSTAQEATSEGAGKRPRKRKRDGTLVEAGKPASSASRSSEHLILVFARIGETIRLIKALSTPRDKQTNPAAVEHMKSVLKSTPDKAARLLGRWMEAMRSLYGQYHGFSMDVLARLGEHATLNPMLSVWGSRTSISASNTKGVPELFSVECLLSTARLLSTILRPDSEFGEGVGLSATLHSLEQLLARHIFVPARSAFFEARQTQRFSSSHEKATVPLEPLRELLAPVLTEVINMQQRSPPLALEVQDRLAWLSRGVSHLFDVALRSSSRSTPKKKMDEAPWTNGLFYGFTQLIRFPAIENRESEERRSQDSYLNQIMRIALDQRIVPTAEHLHAIIVNDSGLIDKHAGDVQWKLVSQVLELDANIFVAVKHNQNHKTGSPEPTVNLSALLFEKITNYCWTRPLTDRDSASKSVKFPDGNNHAQSDYCFIRMSVIIPLMRAFAQARQLRAFIDLWREQLGKAYLRREQSKSGELKSKGLVPAMSVWEDDELAIALEGILEGSLTAGQMLDLLDSLAKGFLRVDDLDVDYKSETSFVTMVVLDAVLSAVYHDETAEQLSKKLGSLQEHFNHTDVETGSDIPKYRIFRIVCHLRDLLLPYQDAESLEITHFGMVDAIFPFAHKAMGQTDGASFGNLFLDAYEAFRLIAVTCTFLPDMERKGYSLQDISESVVRPVRERLEHLLETGASSKTHQLPIWDGRPQSIQTEETCFLAIASALAEYPIMLSLLATDSRKDLLSCLCRLAALQFSANHGGDGLRTTPITYLLIWEGLLDACQDMKGRDHLEELLDTLCSDLQIGTLSGDSHDVQVTKLNPYFDHALMRVTPSALSRRRREAILNNHSCHLQASQYLNEAGVLQQISVMIRLMSVSNATADISTDPGCLWNIARSLDRNRFADNKAIRTLFQELCRLTLSHLLATQDQERSQQYFTQFIESFHSSMRPMTFEQDIAQLALAHSVVSLLDKSVYSISGILRTRYQYSLERYIKALSFDLIRFTHSNVAFTPSGTLLDALLEAIAAIPLEHQVSPYVSNVKDWEDHLMELSNALEKIGQDCPHLTSNVSLAVLLYKASARLTSYTLNAGKTFDLNKALSLLHQDLDARDRQSVLDAFRSFMLPLSSLGRAQLLSHIFPDNTDAHPTAQELSLLTVLVSNLEAPSKSELEPEPALFGLLPKLCGFMCKTSNPECLGPILHCVRVIVRDKQWLVTQHGIDTLLSSIVAVASSTGPALPAEFAGAVFTNLCELMCSLLLLHRKKLGGRFHLVVPVLQTLLRCLYLPSSRHGTRSLSSQQPPWLSPGDTKVTIAPEQASAYTRVLTTLCDPTVSSVTSSSRTRKRSKRELTDETKKAKSYAGQYVQYVIMEYCQCQLKSRLREGVREVLMPGIYAMMDVITPEVMRAMNAGMDSAGRVVFKMVYEGWKGRGR